MSVIPGNLFGILSLMNLMLAGVMTYAWKVSARIAGMGYWAGGFAGISAGQMLLSLFWFYPHRYVAVLAFFLQLTGSVMLFRGCSLFLERPAGLRMGAGAVVASLVTGAAILLTGGGDLAIRIHRVVGYGSFALVFVRTALLFLRRKSFVWGGIRYGAAAALLVLSALQAYRVLESILPRDSVPLMPQPFYSGLFLFVYTGLALTLLQMGYAKFNEQLRLQGEERKVLLREMHHRTKNNLSIVASLLSLESGRLEDSRAKAALDQLGERVRAIGLLHELLQAADSARTVRTDEYIGSVAEAAGGSDPSTGQGVVLERRIEPFDLEIAKAIPIGLIVNELVTNAVKHAFPEKAGGRISVSLNRSGDCMELAVSDDGAGIGSIGRPGSLGLTLVSSLAAQLGGDVCYENEGGTRAVVRFPAACA